MLCPAVHLLIPWWNGNVVTVASVTPSSKKKDVTAVDTDLWVISECDVLRDIILKNKILDGAGG